MSLLDFANLALSVSQDKYNRRQRRKDRELQKEQFNAQMDESIQRRVKDAQEAGIHPLFAMGASVGASPTTTTGQPTGSAVGDAVGRISERVARSKRLAPLDAAQIRSATAQATRDEAEASLLNAERAKLTQEFQSRGRDGVETYPLPEMRYGPGEFIAPQVIQKQKTGVEAGNHALWREVEMADGHKIRIIGEGAMGGEELNQILIPFQGWKHTTAVALKRIEDRIRRLGHNYYYDKDGNLVVRPRKRKKKQPGYFRGF